MRDGPRKLPLHGTIAVSNPKQQALSKDTASHSLQWDAGHPNYGQNANEAEARRIEQAYARRALSPTAVLYGPFASSHLLLLQELERRVLKLLGFRKTTDLRNTKILEVGCGSGHWLRQFVQWGASPYNLAGIDLLEDRIAIARKLCPSGIRLECREASSLDFNDGIFDIVFQTTVFSSILDDNMKAAVAREMLRVLQRDGFIVWHDFFVNNPRNPDVRGIGKHELHRLFPNCSIYCQRITLAPPLGRLLARVSAFAYNLASELRFACTHYLAMIKK